MRQVYFKEDVAGLNLTIVNLIDCENDWEPVPRTKVTDRYIKSIVI